MISHERDFVRRERAGFDLQDGAGIGRAPDGDVVDELHGCVTLGSCSTRRR